MLLHFAQLIEDFFRYCDFIFRYGGDEFVVILNNYTEEEVEKTLENCRVTVSEYAFPSGNLTITMGYALIDPVAPPSLLLEKADNAMYYPKLIS